METYGENSKLCASIVENEGRTQTYVPPLLKMWGQIQYFNQFKLGKIPIFLQYGIGDLLDGEGSFNNYWDNV